MKIAARSGVEDPREMPAYPIGEAAHYLRIPLGTLRDWIRGCRYVTVTGRKSSKPLVILPDQKLPSLSFFNLVEAHVLDAIRREHRIPMHKVRRALDYLQQHVASSHPLADQRFETDGMDLFIERCGMLVSASQSGQVAIRELIGGHLRRIEHDDNGLAVRLFPFTRKRALDEPKNIVIDPQIAFGRPAIAGTGVITSIVAERYKAGESMDELAKDYGCRRPQIEEAVRCELELAA